MESLCIRYGNGWGRILKTGDKVMLEDGMRDLYPKIPKEVREGIFEIVGFTKRKVPKLRGIDNHIYMLSVDVIETIEERKKYKEAFAYFSQFDVD